MEFLQQQFTFTVSGAALVGIILLGIVSLISVFMLILRLIHKIRTLQTPKYGFLGKPLYALVLVAVAGTITYFSYSFSSQPDFQIQASRTVTAEIKTSTVSTNGGMSIVSFEAIPYVNGIPYYGDSGEFDILWNITGPVRIDKFEYGKTRADRSGFSESLQAGSYTARAVIVYEGRSYTFNQPFSVP
ncbi:MAG: hypothetical protein TR69_WS6001001214 [candidate division WS6 bacterium OLB20]|uniref:Uncharacterized protein n=1 Tax=candidate division WS6 bacterium OLB20 TaxID=1617426 RepID=A0A136LX42_9BACT|nr:MAG: hypothetical protein TR69_WS6001001214 [candidate division WS6 bacterium OLB20]